MCYNIIRMTASDLRDREASAITPGSNSPGDDWYERNTQPSQRTDELQAQEQTPETPACGSYEKPSAIPQKKLTGFTFNLQRTGKKGPIIAAILVFLGVGGIGTSMMVAPQIAALTLAESLISDLNTQIPAVDKAGRQLWKLKFDTDSKLSKSPIKAIRDLETFDIKSVDKSIKSAGMSAKYTTSPDYSEGRGKISELHYTPPDGSPPITVKNGEEFTRAYDANTHFRAAVHDVHNPLFASLVDQSAMKVLAKNKTSYAKKVTKEDPKSVDEEIKKATKPSEADIRAKNYTPEKDKEGRETGRYLDTNGEVVSTQEVENAKAAERVFKEAPSTSKLVAGSAARAATPLGPMSSACSAYGYMRMASTVMETNIRPQQIRLALTYIGLFNSMKDGQASAKTIESVMKPLMEQDMREQVVDEAKLDSTPSGTPLPMRKNPNYKKTGMDSALMKLSRNQDVLPQSLDVAKYTTGAGVTKDLQKPYEAVTKLIGGPRNVKGTCGFVNNWAVQGGAFLVGIVGAAGSFGATAIATGAASIAISAMMPYLISVIKDRATAEIMDPKNMSSLDRTNNMAIGMSAYMNQLGREGGLIPMPVSDTVAYQNHKRTTLIGYAEEEALKARSSPFDVTNRFSFIGSLARSSLPSLLLLRQGEADSVAAVGSLYSLGVRQLLPRAGAENANFVKPERYSDVLDIEYQAMGVAVDRTGVAVKGLTQHAMDLSVEDVMNYMVANGELEPNTDNVSPHDNGRDWNYLKFKQQCIDKEPGKDPDANEESDNGFNCASSARPENDYYSKFTVLMRVNDMLNQKLPGTKGGSKDPYSASSQGDVNTDGWAYPSTKEAEITSPFGPRGGEMHRGIDLAQPGGALDKPIYAARDGKVTAAGPASGFGNWIVIQHEVDGKRYDTVYGHMYDHGVGVKAGDEVKAGQEIGKIGSNGQSTGPHLHFEIWVNGRDSGQAVDPAPFVKKAAG